MADTKRLEQALMAAHAAGDTAAATQLAAAIRAERSKAAPVAAPVSAPQKSLLQNIAGEALGGFTDLDSLLPSPAPFGAMIQSLLGVKGPDTQGDADFHNSAVGRGVRFAAPAVVPGAGVTKLGKAANTLTNAGAAFAGGALSKVAEDSGQNGIVQTAAALLPTLGVAGVQGAAKYAIRGGRNAAQEMMENIKSAEGMGLQDFSASQVGPTGNSRLPLLERATSFVFGGQGPFQELGRKQSAQLNAQAERIAGGTLDDAEAAGKAVWNGLFAQKAGWVSRAKASEKSLWAPVDEAIEKLTVTVPDPPARSNFTPEMRANLGRPDPTKEVNLVEAPAIQQALEDIVKSYDDPAMAAALGGDKVGAQTLLDAIKKAGGKMSYNDFKNLRNELGELQSGALIVPGERGINSRQAGKLWAAMVDDYAGLAAKAGVDNELSAAREFSKKYHENSRNFFGTIFGKEAEPTKIMDEIASGNFQQPAKIRALRESLGAPEFSKMQEYVINRLGTPAGSKTGTFSLETFHTNYNNRFAGAGRSGEAVADAMFGAKGSATRDALETMFKLAEKTKEGSALLFNTSGTSGSGIAGASLQAILGDLAKKTSNLAAGAATGAAITGGAPGIAGGIVGGAVLGNLSARLFTSPRFARWLSKTAFQSNARLPAAISALAQTPMESEDLTQARDEFIRLYQERAGK